MSVNSEGIIKTSSDVPGIKKCTVHVFAFVLFFFLRKLPEVVIHQNIGLNIERGVNQGPGNSRKRDEGIPQGDGEEKPTSTPVL